MPKRLIVRGPGLRGPAGRDGRDGVNAIPADEFVAVLVEDVDSDTRAALDLLIGESGGGGGGGSSLLAVADLGPSQGGGYTATTTMTALGGAGGRGITFTAPESGIVALRITAPVYYKQVGQVNYRWAFVDHANQATVVSSVAQLSFNRVSGDDDAFGRREMQSAVFVVTDLEPGDTYAYDWAHQRTGSAGQISVEFGIGDADSTHAVIEAYGVGGVDLAPYARKASAQTISGAWNFTTAPTVNGDPIGSGGGGGGSTDFAMLAPPVIAQVSSVTHGGSSIPTNGDSAQFQLFGKSNSDGRLPYGVFGAMFKAVKTYGAGGHDTIDSLGRGNVIDNLVSTGMVVHDALTNDLQKLDASQVPSGDELTRFKNSWRAVFARYFGGTTGSDNGIFTKTGTWTQQNSPSLATGTAVNQGTGFYAMEKRFVTTTQNDTVTFAVPSGWTSLWVLLSGVDSSQAGYSGAAYSISGGGMGAPVTGTTNDTITRSQSHGADVATIAIKLTGLTPGQTLTLTKTDANGSSLGFEGISRGAGSFVPGPFIIVKCYPGGGQEAVAQAAINTALDQVVAEFSPPADTVITVDPTALGFNADGDMMADGLHPNVLGQNFMRNRLWEVLAGIETLNGAAISAP